MLCIVNVMDVLFFCHILVSCGLSFVCNFCVFIYDADYCDSTMMNYMMIGIAG